jgi:hypothetical protein
LPLPATIPKEDKMATKKAERYSINEATGKKAAGAEAYGAARAKLRSVRGPASDHKCICGAPAVAWVLRADTPKKDTLIAPDRGRNTHSTLRFSLSPAHYDARCSDHRKEAPAVVAKPARKPRTRKET